MSKELINFIKENANGLHGELSNEVYYPLSDVVNLIESKLKEAEEGKVIFKRKSKPNIDFTHTPTFRLEKDDKIFIKEGIGDWVDVTNELKKQ